MNVAAIDIAVVALNRMAFGPRAEDWSAFRALGDTPRAQLEAYIEQQLNPQALDDSACDARITNAGYSTLNKSIQQLWADHVGQDWTARGLPVREVRNAAMYRAVHSKRQLFEVLVNFWHDHFNVFGYDPFPSPTFPSYDRDVIRKYALGNFRQMLEAVGTHAAMLFYLENHYNQRGTPNENYARELMELHTFGTENYFGVAQVSDVPRYTDGTLMGFVDQDVIEVTRCFTGWQVNGFEDGRTKYGDGTFLYDANKHDAGAKAVLGRAIVANQSALKDGRDVYDILAAHPTTAQFIARKLCRRLISDTPPTSVINAAAAAFLSARNASDQIKQTVRVILRSDEFANTFGEKFKRPFEFAASLLRIAGTEFSIDGDGNFTWNYENMGHRLFGHKAPDGYSDIKENWGNTTSMVQRWRYAAWLLEGYAPNLTQTNLASQTPSTLKTANELVDFWIARVLGRSISAATRAEMVAMVAQEDTPDTPLDNDRIRDVIAPLVELIAMSPDFQLR